MDAAWVMQFRATVFCGVVWYRTLRVNITAQSKRVSLLAKMGGNGKV